jgi:hypothetical protein
MRFYFTDMGRLTATDKAARLSGCPAVISLKVIRSTPVRTLYLTPCTIGLGRQAATIRALRAPWALAFHVPCFHFAT